MSPRECSQPNHSTVKLILQKPHPSVHSLSSFLKAFDSNLNKQLRTMKHGRKASRRECRELHTHRQEKATGRRGEDTASNKEKNNRI